MKAPCKGCTDRYPACHDHCDRYKEWQAEHLRITKAKRKDAADSYLELESYRRRNHAWIRQNVISKK